MRRTPREPAVAVALDPLEPVEELVDDHAAAGFCFARLIARTTRSVSSSSWEIQSSNRCSSESFEATRRTRGVASISNTISTDGILASRFSSGLDGLGLSGHGCGGFVRQQRAEREAQHLV